MKTTLSKAPIPTEDQECYLLVDYLERMKKRGKVVLFTHVANENNMRMGIRVAMHRQRLGLRPGFPDYVVVTPNDLFFIEMKRTKGSVISPAQKKWIDKLKDLGFYAKVCYGFDDAKKFIEDQDYEGY